MLEFLHACIFATPSDEHFKSNVAKGTVAIERNSFLQFILVFRKVYWADLGTMVNVVCVLFLSMVSFFRKLKLKISLAFWSSLLTYYISLIKHNIA